MTNAAMMNEEMAVNNGVKMLKAMAEDQAVMAAASMDEAYEAFKKYATVTKDEFLKMVNGIGSVADDVEADHGRRLLTDDELDMVVGGGLISFLKNVRNKIKDVAKKVWDKTPGWVKGTVLTTVMVLTSIPTSIPDALVLFPKFAEFAARILTAIGMDYAEKHSSPQPHMPIIC